ncbi:hypothetical protein [Oryza sativa Japonica Group]|uniref:Uncharacterized protein n=1 Tax=Oryza sativa subsp. japonica TaxID=39947 RepID=Q94D76_ORYSJ|nr:hypothetical protein [Oryza sativa Japonica Group]BAB93441.1 hypothetical protein [Oryza sativa Japonica Group]
MVHQNGLLVLVQMQRKVWISYVHGEKRVHHMHVNGPSKWAHHASHRRASVIGRSDLRNLHHQRPAPGESDNKVFENASRDCLLVFHDDSSSSTLEGCVPTTTPCTARCSCD